MCANVFGRGVCCCLDPVVANCMLRSVCQFFAWPNCSFNLSVFHARISCIWFFRMEKSMTYVVGYPLSHPFVLSIFSNHPEAETCWNRRYMFSRLPPFCPASLSDRSSPSSELCWPRTLFMRTILWNFAGKPLESRVGCYHLSPLCWRMRGRPHHWKREMEWAHRWSKPMGRVKSFHTSTVCGRKFAKI